MTTACSRSAGLAVVLPCLLLCTTGPARADAPVITEFMADNNETLSLAGVGTPDWIELHNPGSTTIDLAGWHLTDNDQEAEEWAFPAGTTIAPGAYLLVYASGLDTIGAGGEIHTNFRLFDQGEYLALVRPDGTIEQEFAPAYPEQYRDVSYGLPPGETVYGYRQLHRLHAVELLRRQ